jgi:hypothetical protein
MPGDLFTAKTINASQLTGELGGMGLRITGPHPGNLTRVRCETVSQATLEAAVLAHNAGPVVNDTTLGDNALNLAVKAEFAITANITAIDAQPARLTGIANAKTAIATMRTSVAVPGKTASVTTLAAAQLQVRSSWTQMEMLCVRLEQLCDQITIMVNTDTDGMKQSNAVMRTMLGKFDSTAGT